MLYIRSVLGLCGRTRVPSFSPPNKAQGFKAQITAAHMKVPWVIWSGYLLAHLSWAMVAQRLSREALRSILHYVLPPLSLLLVAELLQHRRYCWNGHQNDIAVVLGQQHALY
jgi:hypothetical protein